MSFPLLRGLASIRLRRPRPHHLLCACCYFLLSSSSSSFHTHHTHTYNHRSRLATMRMSTSTSLSTSTQQPQGLSHRLWTSQRPLVQAILHHPFVKGIGHGSLSHTLFQGYAAQDAHFLQSFAKAYAFALTKTEEKETLVALSGMIAAVVEELQLHEKVLAKDDDDATGAAAGGDGGGSPTSSSSPSQTHTHTPIQVPSPACEVYTSFLLQVAQDPSSSVAHILAAMCPCMRLYAYLATRLVTVLGNGQKNTHTQTQTPVLGDGDGEKNTQAYAHAHVGRRPEYLQAWLDTYASKDFEEAAAAVEALLDKEADKHTHTHTSEKREEEENKLFTLYAQAMELEYNFFAEHWHTHTGTGTGTDTHTHTQAWQGLQPLLFVTDFDSTCSMADTTHVLAKAAAHFARDNTDTDTHICTHTLWKSLEDRYLEEFAKALPPLLSPPPPPPSSSSNPHTHTHTPLSVTDAATFLSPLDTFEAQAVDNVSASGVLAGIDMNALPSLLCVADIHTHTHTHTHPQTGGEAGSLSEHLALFPYCKSFLEYLHTHTHTAEFRVLSVSWCPDLIMAATGLPHTRITCNSLEAQTDTHTHTRTSTGRIQKMVNGPGGKLRHFRSFLLDAQNQQPHTHAHTHTHTHTKTVFIGDSITDILALMEADVGIIVGHSQTLRKCARVCGCVIVPLLAYHDKGEEEEKEKKGVDVCVSVSNEKRKVLYEAEDWAEIAVFCYGGKVVRHLHLQA